MVVHTYNPSTMSEFQAGLEHMVRPHICFFPCCSHKVPHLKLKGKATLVHSSRVQPMTAGKQGQRGSHGIHHQEGKRHEFLCSALLTRSRSLAQGMVPLTVGESPPRQSSIDCTDAISQLASRSHQVKNCYPVPPTHEKNSLQC